MKYICKSPDIVLSNNARSLIEAIYKFFTNAKSLTGLIFETYAEIEVMGVKFRIEEDK